MHTGCCPAKTNYFIGQRTRADLTLLAEASKGVREGQNTNNTRSADLSFCIHHPLTPSSSHPLAEHSGRPTFWSLEYSTEIAACLERLPGTPVGCSFSPDPTCRQLM
eukprot:scaffold50871_cov14-Tisochrysis_lutea.AAC.1